MDIKRSGINRRRIRRRIIAATATLGAALLLWMAIGLTNRPPAVDSSSVWSGAVGRGEFVHEVTAAGSLVATEIRTITNRSDGVVERILVLPGQVVGPSDVLMVLSSASLPDELLKARSALEVAQSDDRLQRAKAAEEFSNQQVALGGYEVDFTTARLDSDAKNKLTSIHAVSDIEVRSSALKADQQKRRYEAARAQLERYPEMREAQEAASSAKLAQLRREVTRVERQIADLEIRADFHGVVQSIDVEAGKRVGTGTQLARIVNPERLIARVRVSERDASLVQLNQTAILEMGRQTIAGRVTRVEPTVQDRLVTVDISPSQTEPGGLRPDLTVTARIEIERVSDALVLDRPAELRDDQHAIRLFRLAEGKLAEQVNVEVGRISPRQMEILRGLNVGDKVILADMSEWSEESTIRIR